VNLVAHPNPWTWSTSPPPILRVTRSNDAIIAAYSRGRCRHRLQSTAIVERHVEAAHGSLGTSLRSDAPTRARALLLARSYLSFAFARMGSV
jgi:hypothetical protein